MKVAVVGSRGYHDENAVRGFVRSLPAGSVIVSGGAKGVDSWAADEARKCALEVQIFKPDWSKHGRAAGPLRNSLIIDAAEAVVAFWDGVSRGTADSISKARITGKPCDVIR